MIRVSNLILLVFKGNLKARFEETLELFFLDLKGTVSSPFKITTLLEPVDLKLLLQDHT